ncbi:MAG: aminotransferase class V-fold PLP-dependent enzyme [Labilithrix sp.]|nr:aminotransferase class V-fold PLP-dependent enzyme [Labilithrix sp.]MCW5812402.1 aminotransferase class V-fold PLP-dependent enzyme [Labilithrix sp.]
MKTILLNPGPVSMTAKVHAALTAEDVCHREPEFKALVGRVREKITAIYDTKAYTPVLVGGSGTAAVETMLAVIPRAGTTSLVVANGVYGERMAAMLKAQGKAHEVANAAAWTSPPDLAAAEKAIASGRFQHVLAVHHETTTGRLNDLAALGALCKKHGVPMLVDAVSSFAGEAVDFDAWNIEAAAATANKCVHGAPGVSFVLVKSEALARPSGATSVYLDLHKHAAEQAKGSTPFTLPTHVTFALDAALDELAASGGWRSRHATYAARSLRVRNQLKELGVKLLLESDGVYGSTLTSWTLPEGKTYEALHARLKSDGFVIYAGQGKFDGAIFRIAVMGEIGDGDLDRLCASLRAALGG